MPRKSLGLAGASLALSALLSSTPAEAQEATPAPPPPAASGASVPQAGAPPAPYPYPYPYPYYPYPYGWQPPPPPPKPLQFSAAELPPDDEGQFEPASRKANTGTAGKVLIGVGIGMAVLGGVLTAVGATSNGGNSGSIAGAAAEYIALPIGVGSLVTGGICLFVGIPLLAASPR